MRYDYVRAEREERVALAIRAAAEEAVAEIRQDMESGVLPASVRTFAELHDHVDANEYGGLTDGNRYGWLDHDDAVRVQDVVDAWLRERDGGTDGYVHDAALVVAVSDAFTRIIREWLTDDELADVDARNMTREYDGRDAAHDYCDANVAMLDAWEAVVGVAHPRFDGTDTEAAALWGAAWERSRSAGYAQ